VHGVELWWLGQAGFRLRDLETGATVFCDPFLTVRDDRSWQAPVDPAELAKADLVLVSHEHIDHLDRPALEQAAGYPDARFTLVLPRPLVADVTALRTLSGGRLVGAQPDEPIDHHAVRIHPVPARHGVNVDDAYTFGEELSDGLVRYLGYVVELGGVRIYHSGDCSPYPGQAERLRALRPHVALLPINGRDYFRETEANIVGNMDYREAARLASDIGVQLLIPMHWELFAQNRGFPGDLVAYIEREFPRLSVLVMGRGARFVFSPAD
jgi:L-ascorbate metabolism protein UlaG (beta-lactamase superfamily)